MKNLFLSIRAHRLLWMVFFISGLIQLLIVGYMWHTNITPSPRYDATEYRVLAQNILHHGVFSASPTAPFLPEILRTPGYPLFLAVTYLVEAKGYFALVVHILLQLAIGAMVYQLCRRWLYLGYGISVFFTSLWLFDLYSIFIELQTLSDLLFSFLVCASFYLAILYADRRATLFASPLVLGVAIITRPQGFVLAPCLIAILFCQLIRLDQKKLVYSLMAACVSLLILPACWIARNFSHTHSITISSTLEYNSLVGISRAGDSRYLDQAIASQQIHERPATDLGDGKQPFRNSWLYTSAGYPVLRAIYISMIEQHPWWQRALLQLKTLPHEWYPIAQLTVFGSLERYYTPLVYRLLFFIDLSWLTLLLSTSLAAVYTCLQKRQLIHRILLILFVGILLVSYFNAGMQIPRIHIPVLPFALLLSAYGLEQIRQWLSRSLLHAKDPSAPSQS